MTYKVMWEDGKSYSVYYEKQGRYYRQNARYWEKGGYSVPQTCKRISKDEFDRMSEMAVEKHAW